MTKPPDPAEGGPDQVRRSYDCIAEHYRRQFENELDEKPFDRDFIRSLAISLPTGSRVVDLGCGPGQIGRYLAGLGAMVTGVDLSFGMLRQAIVAGAGIGVVEADMRQLAFRDGTVDAVVAFYSLIHIPPPDIEGVLSEIRRALRPGGHLAVTTHASVPPERSKSERVEGGGIRVGHMLGRPVDLDFYFYGAAQLEAALRAAGFVAVNARERDPYPNVEVQTRRAYVTARKAG